MEAASPPVEISAWEAAPFALAGETVFAVGDVHGCAREFAALMEAIAGLAHEAKSPTRLVYLGDMINRGPDGVGVLDLWAQDAAARGVGHIDRLMGNHEQMLMLAAIGGPHARRAETLWLSKRMGGHALLEQMRSRAGDPDGHVGPSLLKAGLGDPVVHCLHGLRSHVRLGNTLFVHGGLDPHADMDEFLARPWTTFAEARWAWINHGFLDWKGGFGGVIVVHGHTPPDKHRAISGLDDPHKFEGDRLGLDGGSARTGIVTAAEISDGRYRIIKAGTPFAEPVSSLVD